MWLQETADVWTMQSSLPAGWSIKSIQQKMDEASDGLDSDIVGDHRDAADKDPIVYGL